MFIEEHRKRVSIENISRIGTAHKRRTHRTRGSKSSLISVITKLMKMIL